MATKKAAKRPITHNRIASEERAAIMKHARRICIEDRHGERWVSFDKLWEYVSRMDDRARKAPGGRERGV